MSAVLNVPETEADPVILVAAPNSIVPVPCGLIVMLALEPFDVISLVVNEVVVVAPVIVGDDMVGLVNTLFVNVCESVNVTTVPVSTDIVTVLLVPAVVIPFPPENCSDSESRSIESDVESSQAKSRSCAVTCEST